MEAALLTKNYEFISIHHIISSAESLTKTSYILWHEQAVLSPAKKLNKQALQ